MKRLALAAENNMVPSKTPPWYNIKYFGISFTPLTLFDYSFM